jgi:trimeric autotransporter adhesin
MKTLLPAILTACLLIMSCGGSGATNDQSTSSPVLTSLQITAPSTTLPRGETQNLTATATYSNGQTQNVTNKVTWTSSAENVATVDSAGVFTAVAIGDTVITAALASVSATLAMTVGPPALTKIDISPSAPTTPANTTLQLVAVGRFTDGSTREVNDLASWSSSDEAKVQIANSGLATGLGSGTVTVTATASTISGSATMTVSDATLLRVALLPYQPVLGRGVVQPFVLLGTFDDSSTHELVSASWSSSNVGVASIQEDGVTTTAQAGSSTITGTVGAISNSTTLTVVPAALVSIVVTPATASMAVGTDQQFTASGVFEDGSVLELPAADWISSNSAVATVDSNGHALAMAPGTSTITVSMPSMTGSSTLHVTTATLQAIAVAPALAWVPVLANKQLYAFGKFSDGTAQDLTAMTTWWSSNGKVATVSKGGLTSSVAVGNAVISASLGTIWGSTTLDVSALTVNSLAVQPANLTLPKGTKAQYSLQSTLSDGSTVQLDAPIWLTSPITMATTTPDGLVTARTADVGKVWGETCCKTAYTQLTVTNSQVVGLKIEPGGAAIVNGAAQPFTALATFDDGSIIDVSNAAYWTSSQPGVALVNGAGLATATATGSTAIAATFGPVAGNSQTATAGTTLTIVKGNLTALTITPGAATLSLGQSLQFTVTGTFNSTATYSVPGVVWQSADPAVAIILPSGLVISTGKGSTVISAAADGVQTTASVTVQ